MSAQKRFRYRPAEQAVPNYELRIANYELSLGSVRLSPGRQPNDQHQIVGLYLGLVGGAATADLPAFDAFGDDDIPLLGIGLGRNGLQISPAGVGAVAGIDIHVPRPEAEGTVVAGGVAQRLDLFAAMDADKAVVQLGKAFLFHVVSFHRIQDFREMDMNNGNFKFGFIAPR